MKNIRTISRGSDGIALQFTAKKSSSEITYRDSQFTFGSPIVANVIDSSILHASAALDFGSIAAGATAELTITLTGATTTHNVFASPMNGIEAGLVWSAYVSAANTITIVLANVTVGAIDPVSLTWKVTAINQS